MILVVEYDPARAARFEQLRDEYAEAMTADLAAGFHTEKIRTKPALASATA